MSALTFFLIQMNLVALYGLYLFISHRKGSLVFNRIYLLAAPILAILIPFINWEWQTQTTQSEWVVQLAEYQLASTPTASSGMEISWLMIAYGSVLFFLIGYFTYHFVRTLRSNRSKFLNQFKGYRVFLLDDHTPSYSFFNRIYLNESQLHDHELILRHEVVHCRSKHTWDIILYSVYRSVFWINPVIHLMERRLRENHEYYADEQVIRGDVNPKAYSMALLDSALTCSTPLSGNYFSRKSLVRKRIEHMKHKNQFTMKHVLIAPALTGLLIATTSMTTQPVVDNTTPTEINGEGEGEIVQPEFKGGKEALYTYMGKHLKYPKHLESKGVEGTSIIGFVVATDGSIENAAVKKSSGNQTLDQEALRVIQSMPKWKPGTKNGKAVRVDMVLPIAFKLADK